MHIARYELLAGILHLRLQLQYTQFKDHSKLWQRDTYLEIAAFPSISSGSDCFRGENVPVVTLPRVNKIAAWQNISRESLRRNKVSPKSVGFISRVRLGKSYWGTFRKEEGRTIQTRKEIKKKKILGGWLPVEPVSYGSRFPCGGSTPWHSAMHHAASLKMEVWGKSFLMREVFSAVIWSFNVKILSSSNKTPAVASFMSSSSTSVVFQESFTTKEGCIRCATPGPTGNASYWRRERWTPEIFRLEISV